MDRIPHINPILNSNPLSGLLPAMLLLTLPIVVSIPMAYAISLSCLAIGLLFFMLKKQRMTSMPSMLTSTIVLPLSFAFYLLIQPAKIEVLYFQGGMMLLYVMVSSVQRLYLQKHPRQKDFSMDMLHHRLVQVEYKRINNRMRIVGLILIFVIAIVYIVYKGTAPPMQLFCATVIAMVVWLAYFYEVLNLSLIRQKLKEEEWLPVMDANGNTVGRVGKTNLEDIKGADKQVPIVRLVALSNGMIYLEERHKCDLCDSDCTDTPFISWVQGNNSPTEVAQGLIDKRFCGIKRSQPRHLITYSEQHNDITYQIHLFVVQVQAPNLLVVCCQPKEGKWWPIAQVMEMLKGETFGKLLRVEMPYLKQTVLLAERIRQRRKQRMGLSGE